MNRYGGFDDYNELDKQTARKILGDELGLTADQIANMTTTKLACGVAELVAELRLALGRARAFACETAWGKATPNDMQRAAQAVRDLLSPPLAPIPDTATFDLIPPPVTPWKASQDMTPEQRLDDIAGPKALPEPAIVAATSRRKTCPKCHEPIVCDYFDPTKAWCQDMRCGWVKSEVKPTVDATRLAEIDETA